MLFHAVNVPISGNIMQIARIHQGVFFHALTRKKTMRAKPIGGVIGKNLKAFWEKQNAHPSPATREIILSNTDAPNACQNLILINFIKIRASIMTTPINQIGAFHFPINNMGELPNSTHVNPKNALAKTGVARRKNPVINRRECFFIKGTLIFYHSGLALFKWFLNCLAVNFGAT